MIAKKLIMKARIYMSPKGLSEATYLIFPLSTGILYFLTNTCQFLLPAGFLGFTRHL